MSEKKNVWAIVSVTMMLLSSVLVLSSQLAKAPSVTWTNDVDFNAGDFSGGTAFETELHGSGSAAYVQNKQDVTGWFEKLPSNKPGLRTAFGMANETYEGRIVLFGGVDGSSLARNDTWEYNYGTNEWLRICSDDTPACRPPKRSYPSMAYNSNSQVIVMYGGYAEDFMTQLADTWEYHVNNNTWINRTGPGGPQRLSSHSMVYDPVGKQMVMVARGLTGMETWVYDASTHVWTQKTMSGGPSNRVSFALSYNYQALYRRVILFGGSELMTEFGDTWEYNPQTNVWQQTTPGTSPSARTGAKMAYSFKGSTTGVILWGGSPASSETWRYYRSGSTPTWEVMATSGNPTPDRYMHGMAYDIVNDGLIIYGGQTIGGSRLEDTWAFESGYRSEGKWYSAVFNTLYTTTDWLYITWNQTPSNVPPSTQMRFQLNISNNCAEPPPYAWYGPGKITANYFTTPGETIGPEFDGFRCIRVIADMLTFNTAVAPRLEDITIAYTIVDLAPIVESSSPTGTGNPTNVPIAIEFSEPMNPANTWLSVVPNVTLSSPAWYQSNSKVKWWHNSSPFQEGMRYDVCVWGTDTTGNTLNHPGGKYCWIFTTLNQNPYVVSTIPSNGALGVSITANIVITFSEPMNTSTCWPYIVINPPITLDGHSWNPTDTVLTMTHSTPFQQLVTYTVEVPMGDAMRPCKDKTVGLLTAGPVANPWQFETLAENPYFTSTDPFDRQPGVSVTQKITVKFSRFMQTGSLTYAFKDMATTPFQNWTGSFTLNWPDNRTVEFLHTTSFSYCNPYQMKIWALDFTGRSLISTPLYPNPFRFMTAGSGANGCAPSMAMTDPYDGQQNVPTWKNITITWRYDPAAPAGGMNPSSFTYSVKDPWDIDVTSRFTETWSGMNNDIVKLEHAGYILSCGMYTVTVLTAKDLLNRDFIPGTAENPFHFWVYSPSCPPIIIWTSPASYEVNVPLNDPIQIKFSKEMNPGSLSVTVIPPVTLNTPSWTETNSNVTITHSDFLSNTIYQVLVDGTDTSGNRVGPGPLPNPWSFKTICTNCTAQIIETYPAAGQTEIPYTAPIYVNFSEPMERTSLQFNLDPLAGRLTYNWNPTDTSVMISHDAPYADCQEYTATVFSAKNKTGGDLGPGPVPNPWKFTAKCGPAPPQIDYTNPPHGAVDVPLTAPIIIQFSEAMNEASLSVSIVPSISLVPNWDPMSETVTMTHTAPFAQCTLYTVTVTARDPDGNSLVPGPVPNPWSFTTVCVPTLPGLQVHRVFPNDVRLTWTPVTGATHYWVYHSNNKFAPWPWTVLANVTTNSYLASNHIFDMQNHFYIVRGFKSGQPTANSTMGVLHHAQETLNVGGSNTFWFSLPYNSMYKKASDIATELGPGKISVVGKWNPDKQKSMLYYYSRGKWRGKDFTINAGDGLWLGLVSDLDWAINGTDKTVPLSFTFRMSLKTNYYWISLPYTGNIGSASQLVLAIAGGLGPGTNTKIDAVGKWDFTKQTSWIFLYGGAGWGGTDFAIEKGDGIWLRVTNNFGWTPQLITPEVP